MFEDRRRGVMYLRMKAVIFQSRYGGIEQSCVACFVGKCSGGH